jgi:hypothetical protein
MTSSSALPRVLTIGLAATLAAVALAAPATGAKKSIKPQPDAAYASPVTAKRGFAAIILNEGKIISATLRAKFKDSDGKICSAPNYTMSGGLTQLDFTVKKPKKPSKKGKYSVKGTYDYAPFTGAKGTFSGKFKSATKASIVVKASWNGCKTGKVTFKNAVPTAG